MAPAMAPRAHRHRARMLAERVKEALTRENTCAPGGIRTPNLLIRRSGRSVCERPITSCCRVDLPAECQVVRMAGHCVAVTAAVNHLLAKGQHCHRRSPLYASRGAIGRWWTRRVAAPLLYFTGVRNRVIRSHQALHRPRRSRRSPLSWTSCAGRGTPRPVRRSAGRAAADLPV
jgi:hypothetical protein